MLLGKLTQPVEKIYQGRGLQTITVTAQYLVAQVGRYTMGELKTDFFYKIGKVEFDEENNITSFEPVIRGNITVESADLENWGTDDFVALQAVANALNVELEEDRYTLEDSIFTY
jgi:hypothetical protein